VRRGKYVLSINNCPIYGPRFISVFVISTHLLQFSTHSQWFYRVRCIEQILTMWLKLDDLDFKSSFIFINSKYWAWNLILLIEWLRSVWVRVVRIMWLHLIWIWYYISKISSTRKKNPNFCHDPQTYICTFF